LDHIRETGATAIWPTPLLEDNEAEWSYHGYACSDYYHIDPRYGSNEMYCEMVRQAHQKGLKVLMDMVPNHCGASHWWMQDLPYKDWINQFPEFTNTINVFSANYDVNASAYDRELSNRGWFDHPMPDMNLDNEDLLRYFNREDKAEREVLDHLLRTCSRLLVPVVFTFGVYVIFNGHLSPGGGFAGGSILGGGLILYAQEFGTQGVSRYFTNHLYHIIKVTALAIYGVLLLYYGFMGFNGLNNHIWLGVPGTILSSGIIMPINVAVGFEVACTIYAFYSLFHKGEIK
jgi:multisubunit Na+/H+ antiporter MnhB subunit